jgi:hypothetical protein
MADKTYTTKSSQTIDYEQRLAREKGDDTGAGDLEPRSFAVEGNKLDGYVGVNPEYMTYANVGQAPGVATKGAEAEIEQRLREAPAGVAGAVTKPEPEGDDQPDKPTEGTVPTGGPADKSGAADAEKGGPARA